MICNNLPQNVKYLSSDSNKFKCGFKKFQHIGSFYTLGGIILNGEQRKIWVLINDLHIDSCLLYMVTCVMYMAKCFVLVVSEDDSSFCCCSLL